MERRPYTALIRAQVVLDTLGTPNVLVNHLESCCRKHVRGDAGGHGGRMNGLGADEKHLVHQPFLKKSVDGRWTTFHEETLNFTVRKLIQKRGQALSLIHI